MLRSFDDGCFHVAKLGAITTVTDDFHITEAMLVQVLAQQLDRDIRREIGHQTEVNFGSGFGR